MAAVHFQVESVVSFSSGWSRSGASARSVKGFYMRATSRPLFQFVPASLRYPLTVSSIRSTTTTGAWCLGAVLLTVHVAGAQQPAPAAVAPVPGPDTTTWTTYKGNNQRSGSSTAKVTLPLNLLWRYSSDEDARAFKSSPLVLGAPGRQRVYFAAGRTVFGLDTQTGDKAWTNTVRLNSAAVAPPTQLSTENGDYILVAQQSGRVAALRTADGGRAWEFDARSSITSSGPIVVQTARGPRIIVAVNAGRLNAFTTEGEQDPDWEVKLGRFGTNPSSSMALSNNGSLIYLTGSDARLYAIDVNKGALAYTVQLPAQSTVTPVVADDQVVVCTSRLVQGLQASGGNQVWSMNPRGDVLGPPAVGQTQGQPSVFLGTANGIFYAVSRTNGAILWRTDLENTISGSPVYLSNMVLVGTKNGLMVALNPNDGSILWRYRLKTERAVMRRRFGNFPGGGGDQTPDQEETRLWGVTAGPAVVDGSVYVLADNAALYCFTTRDIDAVEPLVVEPSLALPDDTNKITSLLLNPDTPLVVPGRGPMYLAVQLDDTGSGVDPASIRVSVDGTPLPAASISFRLDTGVLTATLLDPDKGNGSYPDGLKNLELKAKDYMGNEVTYTSSFLVDNSVPPPTATADGTPDNPGGTPDAGGPDVGAPDNPGGGFPRGGAMP